MLQQSTQQGLMQTVKPMLTDHLTMSTMSGSIAVTFLTKDGHEQTVRAPLGQSLLEVAHANDIELEGAHAAGTTARPMLQGRRRDM